MEIKTNSVEYKRNKMFYSKEDENVKTYGEVDLE
jgi:hypothetical protein